DFATQTQTVVQGPTGPFVYQYSGHLGLTAAFSPNGTLAYVYSDITGLSNITGGFGVGGPIYVQTFDPNLKPLKLVPLGNVSPVSVSVNDDGSFEAFLRVVDTSGSSSTLTNRLESFAADGTELAAQSIDAASATTTQNTPQGPPGVTLPPV